jgi:serine/threonine protein kinase
VAKKAKVYGSRWQVLGNLPGGGQAATFRVRDKHTGADDWVLKRLRNDGRIGRFEREIEALKRLDCPSIPSIEDSSLEDPPFLVTRNVGPDLHRLGEEFHSLSLEVRLGVFRDVVEAVRCANSEGIAHRDIKPDNVALGEDGRGYLLDFGICQIEDDELLLTTEDEAFGNRSFAAPECERGAASHCGPPGDLYSLGKLLYWMTSGGQFLHREDLTDERIDLIGGPDRLSKHYVAQLVRGVVKVDPDTRSDANVLLSRLSSFTNLIERRAAWRASGLDATTDGFGPDDQFSSSSSNFITTPPHGNPPSDTDRAEGFIVTDHGLRLQSVELGLSLWAGSGELDVTLTRGTNEMPDMSAAVSARSLRVGARDVYTLEFPDRPRLEFGEAYWVVLSVAAPRSCVQWWGAWKELTPLASHFSERFDLGPWQNRVSPSGPGSALRVMASRD